MRNAGDEGAEPRERKWIEFAPDDAPVVHTTNLCAHFGGYERCPGFATVDVIGLSGRDNLEPDELVFCTHQCHQLTREA